MGVRELAQQSIQTGLRNLGNALLDLTYKATAVGTYNPATGAPAITKSSYSVKGFLVPYDTREIDGQAIKADDQKCYIATLDLPVTPTLNDTILNGTDIWTVTAKRQDPLGSMWTIQVRRP